MIGLLFGRRFPEINPMLHENFVPTDFVGFWGSGLHASGMNILLVVLIVQSLNLIIFTWFNRVAWKRVSCRAEYHASGLGNASRKMMTTSFLPGSGPFY